MQKRRNIKNILVTGGAGFIGSSFIRFLCSDASFSGKIVNLDLLTYAGNINNVKSVSKDPRYVFQQGDICNQKLVEKLCNDHQIDTIVHFAAETHVDNSIKDPYFFLKTNVFGTFSLLEVVKKRPSIHFHHISTDEVYGSLKKGFFTEKSSYQPNSPYAASKASSDFFVRSYAKTYHLSTTISHCSNNYGPYQHREKLIPLMILHCLEKKELPIYGNGLNIRDWLYVDDHAEAVWKILEYGKKGEVYNIGGEEERSNMEMVKLIIDEIAAQSYHPKEKLLALIRFVKDRPGHDFRYAIDDRKIKKELFWKPRHSLEEGLKKTIYWYFQRKAGTFCS